MEEENTTERIFDPEFTDGAFEAGSVEEADSEKKAKKDSAKKSGGKKGSGFIFLIVIIVLALLAAAAGILNKAGIIKGLPFAKAPAVSGILNRKNFKPLNINLGNSLSGLKRPSGKYVARLYITGVIQEKNETYNQEWLLDTVSDLKDDESNIGIILVIDSPGGTVYESDEAYLALKKYKESGKAVWAYFKGMAASGAYYIASAADTIYANRNTLAGSIGVICGSSIDATEFLSKMGIKVKTFHAGRNKTMLDFNEPLTAEQEAIMQGIADECYEQFTGIVAAARKKPVDEIKLLADGRIYTAKQAKENGLIDQIGTLENTEDRMRSALASTLGLDSDGADSIEFYDCEYVYEAPFVNRFIGMISGIKNPAALSDPLTRAALETLGPDIEYPAYLYRR